MAMGLSRGRSGRRVDSPREAELAKWLQNDTRENSLAGKPLTLPAAPFYLDTPAYLKAMAGPPAWSRRLRRMQELRTRLQEELDAARAEYGRRFAGRPREFAVRWQAYLARLDLTALNALIESHNAYYPIEAALRMQWPSGRYIIPTGIDYPQARVMVETLLAAYPAELPHAHCPPHGDPAQR